MTTVAGEALSPGKAIQRQVGFALSILTAGLGFLVAAVRADKRALHDLIAGTRVERRLPERATPPIEPAETVVPPTA